MTDYVVESGFTRSDITLFGSDTLSVANGGIAVNTIVLGSATITVVSGGSVSGTNVSSGGVLTVNGNINYTVVSAGGDVEVPAGSVATLTEVIAGGNLRVAGRAQNTFVDPGGVQAVLNGGFAIATTIFGTGQEIVFAGGESLGPTVLGNAEIVSSGGQVSGSTVSSGGIQNVRLGGSATNTTISSGGNQNVAGTASGTTVGGGGEEAVTSGGTDTGTVLSGGTGLTRAEEFVASGGTASNTFAISGGFIDVFGGLCVDAVIGDGGLADVSGTMSGTTVDSGGQLIMIGGTDSGTLISGGSETVEPGALCFDPTIEGGSLELTSGSFLSGGVTFAGTNPVALSTVSFDGDSGLAEVASNTISGFTQSGDLIDLTSLVFSGNTSVGFNSATDVLTVTEGGSSATIQLDSEDYTGITWSASQDSGTGTDVTAIPCFCRGTLVSTARGEVAVEDLAIGDEVVILSGEARPIKWIGHRAYDSHFVAGNRAVLPIRIEAGALSDGVPARDLFVSPEHALYIDGVLVPARLLVNGATMRQVERIDRLEYFHVEFAAHEVILAEGAPAESYVDCNNRGMFHNAGEFDALYPGDMRPAWRFCAPRVEPGSAELSAIRAALIERAEALGYRLTDDPDLHLIVDGEIVRAQAVEDEVYSFAVPAGSHTIWLASRSAVPAEAEASSQDGRRLGVPVERIVLRDAGLRIEAGHIHDGWSDGFHDDEGSHRWSDGMARVPDDLLRPFAGDVMVEVHLSESGLRYSDEAPANAGALAVATS